MKEKLNSKCAGKDPKPLTPGEEVGLGAKLGGRGCSPPPGSEKGKKKKMGGRG